VYNRPNVAEQFRQQDLEASRKAEEREAKEQEKDPSLPRSSSAGAMRRLLPDEPIPDPYSKIKETMKPFVERQGKPRIRAMNMGERLDFWNTMNNKYHMKAGGKNLEWNVCKEAHRSTPNEQRWILSNYFRTDTPAVLAGCGSEPVLKSSRPR